MPKFYESRRCTECPTTFQCSPDSRRKTCCRKCKNARLRRVGEELETRHCPICRDDFVCAETSSAVTCGKASCIELWGVVCRKRADARRAESAPAKEAPAPGNKAMGLFGLERDPFAFSMTTNCPGVRSWLCAEMMPFGYQDAGAVSVARRR